MITNLQLRLFFGHQGAEISPTWQKRTNIVSYHKTDAFCKFRVILVKTVGDVALRSVTDRQMERHVSMSGPVLERNGMHVHTVQFGQLIMYALNHRIGDGERNSLHRQPMMRKRFSFDFLAMYNSVFPKQTLSRSPGTQCSNGRQ